MHKQDCSFQYNVAPESKQDVQMFLLEETGIWRP